MPHLPFLYGIMPIVPPILTFNAKPFRDLQMGPLAVGGPGKEINGA